MSNELASRLQCVARGWSPTQHLHIGNVAWAWARADGSPEPTATLSWSKPAAGFADIWNRRQSSTAVLHLEQAMPVNHRVEAIEELLAATSGRVSLTASRQDRHMTKALRETGFVEQPDEPWFAQLWRTLDDLSDINNLTNRTDYQIRPVAPEEMAARVRVHQRSWAPARIKKLLDLPITGDEPPSSYTESKHHLVTTTPIYRSDLDIVAVAADGTLAAYGLGWLDPHNKSVLIEPVGTDPAHGGRGLAHAVCAQILKNAKALGATRAVVGPRGDPGYPIPGRIYRSLGMAEVAQFVPHVHD